MTHTGGSETEKFHTEAMIEHGLYVRSNLTGVGNTRTVPVGKRVEGVCDGILVLPRIILDAL